MTDDATTTPAGAPPTQPSLVLTTQYVKDLSFENPNAPETLSAAGLAPQVRVNVDVRSRQLAENQFEVTLHIKGEATIQDKQAFIVELAYAGVATLSNVQKEHVAGFLLIEAPRQLFPFARAVIAEAVRNGGYPPLMIQPIDFTDLFRRQLEQVKARRDAAGAAGATDGGAAPLN